MIIRNFVVFEGIDGAGTTTQVRKLAERLPAERLCLSSEPTGGETGRFLRRMLGGEFRADARTAAFLFAADRCEHVYGKGGVLEQTAAGKLAVSDRYFFSSLAYQSVSCGPELPALLNSVFPLPELLLYLRIDPETALRRVAARGGRPEIYERRDFQEKTAARYDAVIREYDGTPKAEGMRTVTVDASLPADEIAEIVWNSVTKLPIMKA